MIEVNKKLNEIQRKMIVAKGNRNEFANFSFRKAEEILAVYKNVTDDEDDILLLTSDEIKQVGSNYYVYTTATFYYKDQHISAQGVAREPITPRGKMDESQQTGSASSYALKRALGNLFLLDNEKDSDSLNNCKNYKNNNNKESKVTHDLRQLVGHLTNGCKDNDKVNDVCNLLGVNQISDLKKCDEKTKSEMIVILKKVRDGQNKK